MRMWQHCIRLPHTHTYIHSNTQCLCMYAALHIVVQLTSIHVFNDVRTHCIHDSAALNLYVHILFAFDTWIWEFSWQARLFIMAGIRWKKRGALIEAVKFLDLFDVHHPSKCESVYKK